MSDPTAPSVDPAIARAMVRRERLASPAQWRVQMLQQLGFACAMAAVALGLGQLAPISPHSAFVETGSAVAAGVGILAISVSHLLLWRGRRGRPRVIARWVLRIVLGWSLFYLWSWLAGLHDSVFDQLGHPSFYACVGAMLLTVGTLRCVAGEHMQGQLCLFFACGLGIFSAQGYLLGTTVTNTIPGFGQVSLGVSLALTALSVSAMTMESGKGYIALITGETMGGQVARGLFPIAVLAPIGLGWASVLGYRRGWYDENTAMALTVLLAIALTASVLTWLVVRLRGVDLERRGAESALLETRRLLGERDALARELKGTNEDLEAFATIAARDLRLPLVTIRGYAELLAETQGVVQPDAQRWVARIRGATERGSVLVNDLLAYSKVRQGATTFLPVDLTSLALEVRRLCTNPDAVRVSTLPRVMGELTLLRQLLINLIENALKYMPADRAPIVEIDSVRDSENGRICVRVSDNGQGIPVHERERLLGMFERGNSGVDGSGIGLAICTRVVERHGGRLWIEESARGGARLCFDLPDAGGRR